MKSLFLIFLCVALSNAQFTVYKGKQYNQALAEEKKLDWWQHGVFYQIYPKSFKDSDGDGVGDLKGIIDNLDHLADLGVTGAWLSPIFKSPMYDGGYDIEDFYNVDPMFGTNEDLKNLMARAKELGIKIILDFVPNHTSHYHDWFRLSANYTPGYDEFYVWRDCPLSDDGVTRVYPNNWIAVFHTPAWTYHNVREQCYLHQFTPQQPDLNYRNREVYDQMTETLMFWLREGADGFRIDAINHMFEDESLADEGFLNEDGDKTSYDNQKHDLTMNQNESYHFIYDLRAKMDEFVTKTDNITRMMMTEAYADVTEQVLWYGQNKERLGSHMPFNFALISKLDEASKAREFVDSIDLWLAEMPTFGIANWVMGNHDRPRVGYRYGEDRHESLAIMTMMLPGINVVYYGEEILMTNNMNISFEESDDPQAKQTNETVYLEYSRDPVRTPFQWDDTAWAGFSTTTNKTWLPVHANYMEVNLKAQKAAEKSTFKLYQQLIKLRKDKHVLQVGGYVSRALGDNIFTFLRALKDEQTIATIVNLGGGVNVTLSDLVDGADFSATTTAKILIVNNNSTYAVGKEIGNTEPIRLGPYDAVVLELSLPIDSTDPTVTATQATTTKGAAAKAIFSLALVIVATFVIIV